MTAYRGNVRSSLLKRLSWCRKECTRHLLSLIFSKSCIASKNLPSEPCRYLTADSLILITRFSCQRQGAPADRPLSRCSTNIKQICTGGEAPGDCRADLGRDASTDIDTSSGQRTEPHVASLCPNDGQKHVHSLHRQLIIPTQRCFCDCWRILPGASKHIIRSLWTPLTTLCVFSKASASFWAARLWPGSAQDSGMVCMPCRCPLIRGGGCSSRPTAGICRSVQGRCRM